jgi:hypothetical protein
VTFSVYNPGVGANAMRTTALLFFCLLLAGVICILQPEISPVQAAQTAPAPAQQSQPSAQPTPQSPNTGASFTTDGGAGPCSAEFTVTTSDGRPVFAALINVHIAYGFGGFHKLDMGVYTNQQGKGKFTGIPEKVRKPPLEFQASKNELKGVATVDPATECQARHDIILDRPKSK